MDKQQAMIALEEAKKQIAKCELIINTPDKALGPIFCPEEGEKYYNIISATGPEHATFAAHCYSYTAIGTHKCPKFRDQKTALDWAEAFNVMLELRTCDGNVPYSASTNCSSYNSAKIGLSSTFDKLHIYFISDSAVNIVYSLIGGSFETEGDAERAIAKVGEERICKAIKALANVQ